MDDSESAVNMILKNRFPDLIFKVMSYDPDYPEDVTYHVGQTMKFISNSRFVPNGNSHPFEEQTEEEKGIRVALGKFWEASKPHLKELGKEIYYSKTRLEELRREEREKRQRELNMEPEPVEKKDKGDKISGKSVKFGSKDVQA